ncbi:MAG: YfhO family protein [Thermodesulfobacteriota bacterium]
MVQMNISQEITDTGKGRRFSRPSGASFLVLLLISFVFFSDFVLKKDLPITSADPAIHYWVRVGNADHMAKGTIPLWDQNAGVGRSVFTSDLWKSPFHAGAMFLSLFRDKMSGHVFFLWIQTILFGSFVFYYLKYSLHLNATSSILAFAIVIFTPGFLNEFFYNSFGSYLFVPLMLIQIDKYIQTKSANYAVFLGLLLALSHWMGNFSVPQFSFVFLMFYFLYIIWDMPDKISWILRMAKFFALASLVWIGLMAFYIFPFFVENFQNIRSHTSSVSGGFTLKQIILSLLMPYTSWLFIGEKMVTSGFLTYMESLPFYVSILLLPILIVFFSTRKSFSRGERYFFYFTAGFLFLGWANNYVPLLGYMTKITKGTGWWRAIPLFFLSSAFCIAILMSKLCGGEISFQNEKLIRVYKLFIYALSSAYFLAFIGLFAAYVGIKLVHIDSIYDLLSRMTPRTISDIADYVENYYFVQPRFIFIILIPFTLGISLYLFGRIVYPKDPIRNKRFLVLLTVALSMSQYSLTKIYYPFNSGIRKTMTLKENKMFKQMDASDRIGLIFNSQGEIEERVKQQIHHSSNYPSLRLTLGLLDYPEFNRFQSNTTMFGAYLGSLGINCYTTGANFLPDRTVSFHEAVIKNDKDLLNIFAGQKAYLRLGPLHVNSQLLALAGVNYFLSSLPLESKNLLLVGKGDMYHIYKNLHSVPRFYMVGQTKLLTKRDRILEYLASDKFRTGYEAVIEEPLNLPFGPKPESVIKILENTPNRVFLDVENDRPGLLVISEAYHHGWKALVNGKNQKIYRTNYLFKGILLEKGKNRIEMVFNPPGFRYGIALTLSTLLIISIYLVLQRHVTAGS